MSSGARNWRTKTTSPVFSSTGTMTTAPGWCTRSRSNVSPPGASNVPTATWSKWLVENVAFADLAEVIRRQRPPPPRLRSFLEQPVVQPLRSQRVRVDQVGQPSFGPGQRRSHQRHEQRVGAVRSALELRVGLGARPRADGPVVRSSQPGDRLGTRPSTRGRLARDGCGNGCLPRSGADGARRPVRSRRWRAIWLPGRNLAG